jgi:ATP-dependent protease ClpP protease subunit
MKIITFFSFIAAVMSTIIPNIELNHTNFVSIIGPITQHAIDFALYRINTREVQNQMDQDKKIIIYINSQGGSVAAGNNFVQYMKSLQHRNISVECVGQNFMSMAFHIFQNCDRRMILQNSIGMQHQMSLGIQGNLENMDRYLKMTKKLNRFMNEIEIKKINITDQYYQEKILNDWWIYGLDNIIYNIADEQVLIYCSPEIHDKYIKRREYFNGVSFVVLYSQCPLYKSVEVSSKEYNEFYDADKYADSVKTISQMFN